MLTITNEDNMALMARYPDKYFDLAIVDPPYGIDAGNGTGRSIRLAIERGKIKGGDWDKEIPKPEYFSELFRVSKYQIIWGGNYFPLPTSKSFIIWDKGETMYNRDFAECEFAWVTPDKPAKIYKRSPVQANRIHPTQKPVKLYRWILHNYAQPGFKILDTHLGSGNIAIACKEFGCELVACEKDEAYYFDALKNISENTSQLNLFK
jgi:site-specific DNA-methyltransferase (adenine-specific)